MLVKLLFFAAARDATARSEAAVELPHSVTTVGALLEWLGVEYPALGPYLQSLRIARNEEFADAQTAISAGDTLAIIPPVAGG
jgi:molybdopterin converting factor subunit 1